MIHCVSTGGYLPPRAQASQLQRWAPLLSAPEPPPSPPPTNIDGDLLVPSAAALMPTVVARSTDGDNALLIAARQEPRPTPSPRPTRWQRWPLSLLSPPELCSSPPRAR